MFFRWWCWAGFFFGLVGVVWCFVGVLFFGFEGRVMFFFFNDSLRFVWLVVFVWVWSFCLVFVGLLAQIGGSLGGFWVFLFWVFVRSGVVWCVFVQVFFVR